MEATGQHHGIGLEQRELRVPEKSLRIRVGVPGREEVASTSQNQYKQARNEEEKLVLDGTTRRSQRIAARLAENDEFPLPRDCWWILKPQESFPPASVLAARTKHRPKGLLLPTGVAPLATRIALRVIADSEPVGEHPRLSALDCVKLKAYITHLDSCLSRATTCGEDGALRLRLLPAPPSSGTTSPATPRRNPIGRRVRWWDEFDKENEHSQLARRKEHDSLDPKAASCPPKLRQPKVQKDNSSPLQELELIRRPLQPQSEKVMRVPPPPLP